MQELGASGNPTKLIKDAHKSFDQFKHKLDKLTPAQQAGLATEIFASLAVPVPGVRLIKPFFADSKLIVPVTDLAKNPIGKHVALDNLAKLQKLDNGEFMTCDPHAPLEIRAIKVRNPHMWDDLGQFSRGKELHKLMGENLPSNHKSVDSWDPKDRIATSFKTHDLLCESYNTYDKLYRKLDSELSDLKEWDGKITHSTFFVKPDHVQGRRLDIGIPDGAINPEQKRAIEDIARDAAKRAILLRVTVIR